MRNLLLTIFLVQGLTAQTASSPCDINGDGVVNVADVQIAVNEVLGLSACTMNLDGTGTCDIVDVQRVIAAALGGACVVAQPATTQITLPVEVIGLDGFTQTTPFNIPAGSNLSGTMQLSMQIHGLHYQTQASVQVNNSSWMPISTGNVTLLGLANDFGGIGGGFHTFQMTMKLPAGTVASGANTISFRFNGTNGRVSGFRVLGFNVQDVSGNLLIPSSVFTWEDPTTWQPPSSLASDIQAGKTLWYTGALTVPVAGSTPTPIVAHCTDCHAQDGRDLKYFNYSNNSIQVRSMFHGLTAQQGNQIASYIRSLNIPNPGRPWNPPYQPGPGLDSLPVSQWAAGAGINSVLAKDADMLPYLMPGGSTANWAPSANLSAREVPVEVQLPDWNQWLPGVSPMDAWGSAFLTSDVYTGYQSIRANLVPNDATSYQSQAANIWTWNLRDRAFLSPLTLPVTDPGWNNPYYAETIFGTRMWNMVKHWEVFQEFGLEGMAQVAFGPQADTRAWYTQEPFFASPNMIQTPQNSVGNGLLITWYYTSFAWYHVQLILNYSNNRGTGQLQSIDWPYVLAHLSELATLPNPGSMTPNGSASPAPGLLTTLWLVKGLQASENGNGPEFGSLGWALNVNNAGFIPSYMNDMWNSDLSPADQLSVMQGYLQYWIGKVTMYQPSQYYAGGWASATEVPNEQLFNGNAVNWVAYMIPQLNYVGVSPTLTNQVIAWAQTVWPAYNWSSINKAVCVAAPDRQACSW